MQTLIDYSTSNGMVSYWVDSLTDPNDPSNEQFNYQFCLGLTSDNLVGFKPLEKNPELSFGEKVFIGIENNRLGISTNGSPLSIIENSYLISFQDFHDIFELSFFHSQKNNEKISYSYSCACINNNYNILNIELSDQNKKCYIKLNTNNLTTYNYKQTIDVELYLTENIEISDEVIENNQVSTLKLKVEIPQFEEIEIKELSLTKDENTNHIAPYGLVPIFGAQDEVNLEGYDDGYILRLNSLEHYGYTQNDNIYLKQECFFITKKIIQSPKGNLEKIQKEERVIGEINARDDMFYAVHGQIITYPKEIIYISYIDNNKEYIIKEPFSIAISYD